MRITTNQAKNKYQIQIVVYCVALTISSTSHKYIIISRERNISNIGVEFKLSIRWTVFYAKTDKIIFAMDSFTFSNLPNIKFSDQQV